MLRMIAKKIGDKLKENNIYSEARISSGSNEILIIVRKMAKIKQAMIKPFLKSKVKEAVEKNGLEAQIKVSREAVIATTHTEDLSGHLYDVI